MALVCLYGSQIQASPDGEPDRLSAEKVMTASEASRTHSGTVPPGRFTNR